MCNTFLESETGLQCYVPYLLHMEAGLQVLAEYGGSFFTDKQREVKDELGVVAHYCKPKERLAAYLAIMQDLCYCAQKQYLHGVSLVKVSSAVSVVASMLVVYQC